MRKSELNLVFVLIIILYVIIWSFLSFTCFFFLYWLFNGNFVALPLLMGGLFLIVFVLMLFCKGQRKKIIHPIVVASFFTVFACISTLGYYHNQYDHGHICGNYIFYHEPDIVRDKFGNVVFQTDKDIDRVSFDGMVYFSDETRVYSLKTKEWIYPN